jgi:hypothetical protein
VAILRRHLLDKVPVSDLCVSATLNKQSSLDMAKNHHSTKPKRRNGSGKSKDTQRVKANMAKIRNSNGTRVERRSVDLRRENTRMLVTRKVS